MSISTYFLVFYKKNMNVRKRLAVKPYNTNFFTMQFKKPPILQNRKGEIRKVGFELEFANLGIEDSAKIIQDLYGGEIKKEHRFSQQVEGTSVGDFSIKIDLKLLNEKSYKKTLGRLNINLQDVQFGERSLEYEVESAMEGIFKTVIPYEITTPPLAITELEKLEKLRQALYEHNAEGTRDFLTNAFATHINPEVPDITPESILSYIRAFLLLYPWLLKKREIDLARRVSTFISPFPSKYVDMVLQPSYKPDINSLIEDYHIHNPDRNRPLDMYPLFAAIKEEKVSSYQDIGNVKSRETYHYRLPNSLLSSPDWSLAEEWNVWVLIEELANDHARLAKMSKDYLELRENTYIGFDNKWSKQTDEWLS